MPGTKQVHFEDEKDGYTPLEKLDAVAESASIPQELEDINNGSDDYIETIENVKIKSKNKILKTSFLVAILLSIQSVLMNAQYTQNNRFKVLINAAIIVSLSFLHFFINYFF